MNFTVRGGNPGSEIKVGALREKGGVYYADISYSTQKSEIPQSFRIDFTVPDIDCYSVFSPCLSGTTLHKGPNWRKRVTNSRLASGMPLHSVVSARGRNRITIALSDAMTPASIGTGTKEEDALVYCSVELFTQPTAATNSYKATLRLDMRDIPYCDSVTSAVEWWENECGYTPAYVPEHARLPMNSLWYSFHQDLDPDRIVEQCRLSKPLGMETVIVDDGWQTEDNNRGYAYCGDWEVATAKIPDMKQLVDRVHDTGMKFMLWYSVPFIGRFSKVYDRFKDMLLDGNYTDRWAAIDPRYKEAREYLIGIWTKAVRDWGLDGLKLDFIDSFKLAGKSLEPDERRDYTSLEEAVDALMREATDELLKINPELMIEFRQTYVGPTIRKYGNMMRVFDCPNDAFRNRVESVNLRLTCSKTAVHSDMLMWNYEDSVESAALQIVNSIYAVPQISVLIDKLSDEHYRMLKYYLSFWRQWREVILDGHITAENPESNFSRVASVLDKKAVVTLYTNPIVDGDFEEFAAINATNSDSVLLKGFDKKSFTVLNCMGETLSSGVVEGEMFEVTVPLSGMVLVK